MKNCNYEHIMKIHLYNKRFRKKTVTLVQAKSEFKKNLKKPLTNLSKYVKIKLTTLNFHLSSDRRTIVITASVFRRLPLFIS